MNKLLIGMSQAHYANSRIESRIGEQGRQAVRLIFASRWNFALYVYEFGRVFLSFEDFDVCDGREGPACAMGKVG